MSSSSSSSISDFSEPSKDHFGPLLSITQESLVNLASRIRHQVSGQNTSQGRLIERIDGSHNLVHIVELDNSIKYVIRVPVTGWGNRFTDTAKRALESQALTMRFLRTQTTIPLPDVYHFETTTENEIGAPYIAMSFIDGHTVVSKWFDDTGSTPLETRRLTTLTTVEQAMAQLRKFRFDKIGTLQFDGKPDGEVTIGPCYDWEEDEDGNEVTVKEYGPFRTSQSYLLHDLKDPEEKDPLDLAVDKLTKMMVLSLPSLTEGSQTFVFSCPGSDSNNIMIDEQVILDIPRYPGWITRDLDQLLYGWPDGEENSPDELVRYRKYYNEQMKTAMGGEGDWKFTGKSHMFQAICIAAQSKMCRIEIVRKFVEEAFKDEEDFDAVEYITDVGDGREDGNDFEEKVKSLISLDNCNARDSNIDAGEDEEIGHGLEEKVKSVLSLDESK